MDHHHRTDQADPTDQHLQSDPTALTDGAYTPIPYEAYAKWLDSTDPDIRANAIICLIHQANYLLDKQIQVLELALINDGGYSEQLATARIAERNRQKQRLGRRLVRMKTAFPHARIAETLW